MLKITRDILSAWDACRSGTQWFNETFPEGATLQVAADAAAASNHVDWAIWLFNHSRQDERFQDQAKDGFRNTGDQNTGDQNTGHQNTGDRNTGDQNTGHWNTGDQNTGHQNTGHWNTGHWNTGDQNTGHQNTGDRNTGDQNTGHWNTGHQNTGHWNTGHQNTGFFNTVTPEDILIFNKSCKKSTWDNATKPQFIFNLELTYWVPDSEMTDEEKASDLNFYMRGGQTRSRTYQEAWKLAAENVSQEDIALLKALPNFDSEIFFQISGLRF